MSSPQKSKSGQNRVQFRTENRDSDSNSDSDAIDLADSTKTNENEPDYYDPIYFDSDSDDDDDVKEVASNTHGQPMTEEQDDDEKEYDVRAGISGSSAGLSGQHTNVKDITKQLEESSLHSPKNSSKKSKKHPTISDADLLYDPDQDDRDQEWLMKKIAGALCFDCQQHEFYPHQFRAMFVENCRVLDNEILRFPKEAAAKKRNRNNNDNGKDIKTSLAKSSDFAQGFKPSTDDDDDMAYHPVVCEICNTKVALMDQDEVFHFFNVIPDEV
ncbi:hypothetical protein BGX21_003656 [Mortierella sp. AD011]|nr:hypothetical protein BGX20_001222 [Mortierella sp. AD010]KAF9375912.1 hypothetical protein BGX21_003656 [Mortierella sp. AD011]